MGLFFSSVDTETEKKYVKLMQQQEQFWAAKYKRLEEQKNALERKLKDLVANSDKNVGEVVSNFLKNNEAEELVTVKHRLSDEVERVVREHLEKSLVNDLDMWQLIFSDTNNIQVYRREYEENGVVCDPLKAVCTVKGITGHEVCKYFWDPACRLEWEGIVESLQLFSDLNSDDTVIVYELLKKHFAASQRDVCFWSHIRPFKSKNENEISSWIVVNHSTDHDETPKSGSVVRAIVNIALICTTKIDNNADITTCKRENLTCEITYVANINPGGWVPVVLLRDVTKKECSNFIKRFSTYVKEKTAMKPILF